MLDINHIRNTVSTAPFYSGGASFKTHNLKKTNTGFAFKASLGALLFTSLFTLIGLSTFTFGSYSLLFSNAREYGILIVFGAIFLAAGLYIGLHFLKPRTFNKNSNFYYKGFRTPVNREHKNYVLLHRIVAFQLIGETISGSKGSYKSFELNLVLDDASRINVIDHGNLKTLIDDTQVLSQFLNIPIWHAESSDKAKV